MLTGCLSHWRVFPKPPEPEGKAVVSPAGISLPFLAHGSRANVLAALALGKAHQQRGHTLPPGPTITHFCYISCFSYYRHRNRQ